MADASVVTIEDCSFTYPATDDPVLDGVDLSIERGEFLALLGGNGSGKTTLCKTINGVVPHFFAGEFGGRVEVMGTDTREASVAALSRRVGYVYQDFENQLVQPIVRDDVEFAPLNYGLEDYRRRAAEAMDLLGIGELAEKFVWELSGGQKHLVAIAGAMSMDPDLLIVDEPAAQLDPGNARSIYGELRRLNESHGKTVVVIEHDTELVAEYCDRVALLADGTVRWKRPVEEALTSVDDLRAQNIRPPQVTRVAERVFDAVDAPEAGRPPITVDGAVRRFRSLGASSEPERPPEERSPSREDPVVEFSDVSQGYRTMDRSFQSVFDGLDRSFYEGDRVALLGANGSGKSTLLKLVTGVTKLRSGTVTVFGTDTAAASPEEIAETVVYIHQNPEEMFIEDSVRDDIEYYLRQRSGEHREYEPFVDDIIASLDLEDLADRDGRLLSVGQMRRASLGIGLAMRPKAILLDEPTGSLDVESRAEVVTVLDRLRDVVGTVIIATHDVALAAKWANRALVLDDGNVLADAPPRDVFAQPETLERARLSPPPVTRLSLALGVEPPALTVDELADRFRSVLRPEGVGR